MAPSYRNSIECLYQLFTTCPDPNKRESAASWSIKQIVGHLIDSVSNNHQRLSRYIPQGDLMFPAYDQNAFVRRAQYSTFDFQSLVDLWYQYNQLLLHMIENIPEKDLRSSTVTIGDHPPVTIEQLVNDYYAHIEKHERQVTRIIQA
jgi:hypothetical protein